MTSTLPELAAGQWLSVGVFEACTGTALHADLGAGGKGTSLNFIRGA